MIDLNPISIFPWGTQGNQDQLENKTQRIMFTHSFLNSQNKNFKQNGQISYLKFPILSNI